MLDLFVSFAVTLQALLCCTTLLASRPITMVIQSRCMDASDMTGQVLLPGKGCVALLALKWALLGVCALMGLEISVGTESLSTRLIWTAYFARSVDFATD